MEEPNNSKSKAKTFFVTHKKNSNYRVHYNINYISTCFH